jgi:microcompartment protein CcmK/EutM
MLLARVIGNVVSTMKDPALHARKILVLQPVDRHGQDRGAKLLALDSVGAGAGERVYYCRGREASFPWYPDEVPTDSTIVGIVDPVNIKKKQEPEGRRQQPEQLPRRVRGHRRRWSPSS